MIHRGWEKVDNRQWLAIAFTLTATALAAPARADDGLGFRGSFSWLGVGQHATVTEETAVNPDNTVLLLPSERAVSELRPNLKVTAKNLQIVARPRVTYTYQRLKAAGSESTPNGDVHDELYEGFLQWTVSDSLTFAYGRQSYQWGAAEVLSPSNRLFHDTVQQHDVLYEVRGEDLARLNLSLGKQFSTVVMARVKRNNDQPAFQAEEAYQNIGLVKSEVSWSEGSDYLGLVVGGRARSQPWAGAYFSSGVPFFDGLSVYADGSMQRGSGAWYPSAGAEVLTPLGPQSQPLTMAKTRIDDGHTYALVTGGWKFDFVNGTILRGEYIYNQAGYTQDERDQVLAALTSPDPRQRQANAQNLPRFLLPGLDLPGQRYGYLSLHVPDLFSVQDLVLDTRALRSLADASVTAYANIDYKVGDNGTLSAAAAANYGPKDSELKGYASSTYTLAYRHDW